MTVNSKPAISRAIPPRSKGNKLPAYLRKPDKLTKVKQLSDATMAKGPGKRSRVVYNVKKNELNFNKNDIMLLDDGLYKCSQVNQGSGCCAIAKVTLLPWDPKKNANGKLLVKRK